MAALSLTPFRIPLSQTTTTTFIGNGTTWLSGAPTFTPTGVAGVSCGTVTVLTDVQATAPITTGSTSGTVTWTDSTTSATATQTILNKQHRIVFRRS